MRDEKAHKLRTAMCGQTDKTEGVLASWSSGAPDDASGLVKPMKGQTIQGIAGPAHKVKP